MATGLMLKGLGLAGLVVMVALTGCLGRQRIDPGPSANDSPLQIVENITVPLRYAGQTKQTVHVAGGGVGLSGSGVDNPHQETMNGTPQTLHLEISWAGAETYTATVSALMRDMSGSNAQYSRQLASAAGSSRLTIDLSSMGWREGEGHLSIYIEKTRIGVPPATFTYDPATDFEVLGSYVSRPDVAHVGDA